MIDSNTSQRTVMAKGADGSWEPLGKTAGVHLVRSEEYPEYPEHMSMSMSGAIEVADFHLYRDLLWLSRQQLAEFKRFRRRCRNASIQAVQAIRDAGAGAEQVSEYKRILKRRAKRAVEQGETFTTS